MELIPLSDINLKIEEMYDDPEKGYNYARIVVGPLNEGYGITIGNMLRRVLLSSIEGAAPIAYKLSGFYHEFTSLEGIYEDGLQITMNLKNLVVKLEDSDFKTLYISKKGPAVVRAADISRSADVEVINGDLRLFEITEPIEVKMEIFVAKGRGYMTEDEVKEHFAEITPAGAHLRDYITIDATSTDSFMHAGRDLIFIDAFFSPVKRVAYKVIPARVGKSSKYDQLILEIWTDRSVSAVDALREAVAIMRDRLSLFDMLDDAVEYYWAHKEEDSHQIVKELQHRTPIAELGLPDPIAEIIQKHGIDTVEALIEITRNGGLEHIPHIGAKRRETIIEKLEEWLSSRGEKLFVESEGADAVIDMDLGDKADENISVLGLGSPVEKNLKSAGIETIKDLVDIINSGKLTSIKGIGQKRAEKIIEDLKVYLESKGADVPESETTPEKTENSLANVSIDVLELPATVIKILEKAGISTLAQLKEALDADGLTNIRGIGATRKKKIEEALTAYLQKGGQ